MNDTVIGATGRYNYRVSQKIGDLQSTFQKKINKKEGTPSSISIEKKLHSKEKDSNKKWYELCYKTGIFNTVLQGVAGIVFTGASIYNWKKGIKETKDYKGVSKKIFDVGKKALAVGYLVGGPSVIGAGIKAEQPGTVLSGVLWTLSAPFINKDLGTRTKALLNLGYAPTFVSFANEINNRYRNNKKERKINIDYLIKKDSYLNFLSPNESGKKVRKKAFDTVKFCITDQIESIKTVGHTIKKTFNQSIDFATGETKNLPDLISTKPSKESLCLGSSLILLGSIPQLLLGDKLGEKNIKLSGLLIGAGLFFESIGMISLANQKNDSRRPAVLLGGPMRIIGDFVQSNPIMYGLRTLGGSSFEYYYTMVNREENGKVHVDSEPALISNLIKKNPGLPLKLLFGGKKDQNEEQ